MWRSDWVHGGVQIRAALIVDPADVISHREQSPENLQEKQELEFGQPARLTTLNAKKLAHIKANSRTGLLVPSSIGTSAYLDRSCGAPSCHSYQT